jgi:hypothetical protein
MMKLFERSSTEEPPKNDRRKDSGERFRRQRDIDEERHRRLQLLRPDLRLFGF